MKYITTEEQIHITSWTYILNGRLISIIYEKDGEHKRYIKFLRPSPQLDSFLLEHLQTQVSVSALNEAGANWVDEEPYFEEGLEVPVEVDAAFAHFCAQSGITVTEYLHGLSCYFCNPANREFIVELLNEIKPPTDHLDTDSSDLRELKKTDAQKRNNILFNSTFHYFLDNSTGIYHTRDCDVLSNVPTAELRGLGKKPWKSSYTACCFCCGGCAIAAADDAACQQEYGKDKSQTIGMQLVNIGKKYGLHVKINHGTAYVTTAAGEWLFLYNDRPITLRHRNSMRCDGYHRQLPTFYSPAEVLRYIYFHERAAVVRSFGESQENTE